MIDFLYPQGNVIGLTGYATCGKDTLADFLVEERGWVKMGWADPLYEMAVKLNPWVRRYRVFPVRLASLVKKVGWTEAKKNKDVRTFLQYLGTEVVRETLMEDAFVLAGTRRLDDLLEQGKNVVITNCRFQNEADAIQRRGGVVVCVTRPGVGPVNGHVSDAGEAMKEAIVEIVNDGSLQQLKKKAMNLHESLEAGPIGQLAEIRSFMKTKQVALQRSYKFILECSSPLGADLNEFTGRHRVELELVDPDNMCGNVLIDGELAGDVTYEDGAVSATVFLARKGLP